MPKTTYHITQENNTIPIVVTSINSPSNALVKFSKLNNFCLLVAGDRKTPTDWNLPNCNFLSIEKQNKKYPKLSKLVMENTYCRKMFAYLEAIRIYNPNFIYETDDDNLPYSSFPNFTLIPSVIPTISLKSGSSNTSFNIYSLFTKKNIWPRGYPLSEITQNPEIIVSKETIFPMIQQSLADLDPDVDSIYRLTNTKHVRFAKNKIFAISKNIFCPVNTQNTLIYKKLFPLLYLPTTVNNRVTDIWRGYIFQRILWDIDGKVIFLSPSVYQKRNIHNYLKDFVCELDLYQKTETLLKNLIGIKLKGGVEEMLFQIYSTLVKEGFFNYSELKVLEQWLHDINQK